MNLKISEDTILPAARRIAKRMPRTRLHPHRNDWTSEAYLLLLKRLGQPYWSSVNWTVADLRRKFFSGPSAPEAEADQHDGSWINPQDHRHPPVLQIVQALETYSILRKIADGGNLLREFNTLSNLDMTTKEKARRIPGGHNRITSVRKYLANASTGTLRKHPLVVSYLSLA